MPIIPYSGMVDSALKLKNDVNLWIAIGKTSAWADEQNPPAEDPAKLLLDEVIVFKKVESSSLVVPDGAGTIITPNQNYRLVNDTDGVAQNARWVYLKTSISYAELGNTTYRETGIFSGLIALPAYVNNQMLTPDQVQDPGRLIFLADHTARTHSTSSRNILEIIIEKKS